MSQRRTLSEEERILWGQVAGTTVPLRPVQHKPVQHKAVQQKAPAAASDAGKAAPAARHSTPSLPSYQPAPAPPPVAKGHIDRQTTDKLAKGRLPLEARVDLHGMRQDEAYALLLSFMARAHDRGVRYVLIITGKGPGGDGVLKRSVPSWLRTPPFERYVSGLDQAARGHGGAGALYVRVKRHRP